MNYKKILLLSSEFPPQPGGIGNHAFNLAGQLDKNGYEVHVLTDLRSTDGEEEKIFDNSLSFKVVRIIRFRILIWTYMKRIIKFRRIIKRTTPDLLIASGKFPLWLVAFGIRKSNLKKMAVVHGSELNLSVGWQEFLTNRALNRFDKIVAVSHYTKSLVDPLKLTSISVIPNGFDLNKLKESAHTVVNMGYPALITVGNLSERKGQHLIIEKLPELLKKFPKIHYHMVGIPSDAQKLLKLAKKLQVEKYISVHGVLEQAILNGLLAKSDIFVMLSQQTKSGDVEGFGISILEANYMGVPAIGALDCGIEDAIDNKASGILIQPSNSKAMVEAIDTILSNKEHFRAQSKKWAADHRWSTIISKYINLINNL